MFQHFELEISSWILFQSDLQTSSNTQTDRQTDRHTHTHTHTHRHTDRQTDRQTDTHTHRHTHTQTDRQTDRHTHTHTHTHTHVHSLIQCFLSFFLSLSLSLSLSLCSEVGLQVILVHFHAFLTLGSQSVERYQRSFRLVPVMSQSPLRRSVRTKLREMSRFSDWLSGSHGPRNQSWRRRSTRRNRVCSTGGKTTDTHLKGPFLQIYPPRLTLM